MPAYNAIDFIDEAVASVLAQDYRPLELIISDDASQDGTAERIAELAAENPGLIRPLVNPANLGITANFNQAFRAANGKYLALAAGDDLLLPGKLRAQVRWLEASEKRVLCGHDVEIFESGTGRSLGLYSEQHALAEGTGPRRLIREGVLYAGSAVMFRREALPAHLHDSRLTLVSDWQIQIETLASGGEYGFVPGVLARYRRHAGSATAQEAHDPVRIDKFLEDRLLASTILQLRHPAFTRDFRFARSRFLLTAGRHSLHEDHAGRALHYLAWAAREHAAAAAPAAAAASLAVLPPPLRRTLIDGARARRQR